MMKLLIVTDHTFFRTSKGVFDNYCYDRAFYDDYRGVFEQVEVVARIRPVTATPVAWSKSDGHGVGFVDVADVHALPWLLGIGLDRGRLIRRAVKNADAVVLRVPSVLGWLAAKVAWRTRKPYMIELVGDPWDATVEMGSSVAHKLLALMLAWRLKWIARRAVCGNYVSRLRLPQRYPVSPGCPFDTISSIRLSASGIATPRVYDVRPAPFKIVMVGNFATYKRQIDLIKACAEARRLGVDLQLDFAGDGIMRSHAESSAAQLGLRLQTHFHGHITDKGTLRHLLDSSDLCFFSTSNAEGLPRAILESMARGLPVAATRAAGNPELVRDSELVEIGDIQSMSKLIGALAGDPLRLTAMSTHSVETAGRYTKEQLSPKRVRLYEHLRARAVNRLHGPKNAVQAHNI